MLTGKINTMDLETTQEKLDIFFDGPRDARPLIQDLFSELTTDEREFLQTGATPEEWGHQVAKTEALFAAEESNKILNLKTIHVID